MPIWYIVLCVSDWFKATQAMAIIGLVGLAIALLLICLYMCVHGVSKNSTIIGLVVVCILTGTCTLWLICDLKKNLDQFSSFISRSMWACIFFWHHSYNIFPTSLLVFLMGVHICIPIFFLVTEYILDITWWSELRSYIWKTFKEYNHTFSTWTRDTFALITVYRNYNKLFLCIHSSKQHNPNWFRHDWFCAQSITKKINFILLLCLALFAVIFMLIALIIYGTKQDDLNWSYALVVLGCIFTFVAGILSFVQLRSSGVHI